MGATQELAEFVVTTRYQDLPRDVVERTVLYLVDGLACGLVAAHRPWSQMVASLAWENGARGPCTVFGERRRTSPAYAALVNGTMLGGFETDHVFPRGSAHPAASVLPALLAISEREHLDGRSFLTAMALGYEVVCRVGEAATRAVEDVAGFHGPGTNGAFGAAAAVGKALGFGAKEMVHALGIAGSHGGGLLEFVREGAMTKRLHVGRASHLGLESALLAVQGFTGPTTVLEGPRGFLKVYSPSPRPEALTEGLGTRYLMLDLLIKSYPCHARCQGVVDALCRFAAGHRPDIRAMRRVTVPTTHETAERHGEREPGTLLGAQYSLPFSVAVALARDASNPASFSDETLWDEGVRSLARRVELDTAATAGSPLRLATDSREVDVPLGDWKGSPTNPHDMASVSDKFLRYAVQAIPEPRARRLLKVAREVEEVADMGRLAALLRPSSEGRA